MKGSGCLSQEVGELQETGTVGILGAGLDALGVDQPQ
jgi:hypothetical protein